MRHSSQSSSTFFPHAMYECGKWQCLIVSFKKNWVQVACILLHNSNVLQFYCVQTANTKHTICCCFIVLDGTAMMCFCWYMRRCSCAHETIIQLPANGDSAKTREDGTAVWVADTPHTHTGQCERGTTANGWRPTIPPLSRVPMHTDGTWIAYVVALAGFTAHCCSTMTTAICKIRDGYILIQSTCLWLCALSIVLLTPLHQQFYATTTKFTSKIVFFFYRSFFAFFAVQMPSTYTCFSQFLLVFTLLFLLSASFFCRQRVYNNKEYRRIRDIIMTVVVSFCWFSLTSTNY